MGGALQAFSLNGENARYGTPANPACPDRVPGGSSSGSAVRLRSHPFQQAALLRMHAAERSAGCGIPGRARSPCPAGRISLHSLLPKA